MRRALLAGVTAIAITSIFGNPSLAACPEDIEAFEKRYQQAVGLADEETVLTEAEKADLSSLRTAARELQEAGDADACATVIYRANGLLESAIAPQAVAPETLVDRALTNGAGEDLGSVEEVLIDPMSGRIAYLLVEHGGFLGIGDELFAIPWAVVRYLPGDEARLLIDIKEAQLERAPRFSRTDRSLFGEREWALSVHNFYGVQPYWRFRGGRAMMARTEAGSRENSGQDTGQDTGQETAQDSGQASSGQAGGADGGSGTMQGDGELAETSLGASDNDGEEAQLQAQLSELGQRLDRQSQSIDELKRIEQSFSEARASDQQVASQIEQLTAQLGEVQKQLDEVSVRLERAGMRESGSERGQSDTPRQGASQSGSGQADRGDEKASDAAESDPATNQEAAAPDPQSAEDGDRSPASQCTDQIAALQDELRQGDTASQSGRSVDSAREQLKIAETMAEQGAEESCLSAVERARQGLVAAKSGSAQQND